MSKKQLSEREKLKRDLREWIALRALPRPEWPAAIRDLMMRKHSLSAADLERRTQRHLEMSSPDYASPEWKAELERLRPFEAAARIPQQKRHAPPANADAMVRDLMMIAGKQAAKLPVELYKTPGQRREGHTDEQRAAARRVYRWLWRRFPGQLRACDAELRELIRQAGGIA